MKHPSRHLVAVLAALAAGGACSVYGPDDLPGLISGGSPNAGKGGASGGRGSGGGGTSAGGAFGGGGASGAGAGGEGDSAGAESGGKAAGGSSTGGVSSEAGRGGTIGSTGGASGGAPTGGKASGGGPTGGAAPSTPPELIDDMEDQDDQILIHEARDGYWYTSADSVGSTVDPAPGMRIVMTPLNGETGAGGESAFAFHFSGKSLPTTVSGAWGALGGFDLLRVNAGVKQPYDAHIYKGVRFWAKAAASNTQVRVRLPLRDTTAGATGSKCSPNTGGPATAASCDDFHYKGVSLGTSWTRYDLVWSEFGQAGWGYAVKPLDPATLVSVQFLIVQGNSGEIWIDDVSFIP